MKIIDGFQKKHIKLFEKFITTTGWIAMIIYILQIILSLLFWIFNINLFYKKLFIFSIFENTVHTLLITVILFIIASVSIVLWGKYNYKKYAHLNRRKFPKTVTMDDTIKYFSLPDYIVEDMKNNKKTKLKNTIV